jgi:hypothetical protein
MERFGAVDFEAPHDAAAIERARQLAILRVPVVELWRGDRVVYRGDGNARDPSKRPLARRPARRPSLVDRTASRRGGGGYYSSRSISIKTAPVARINSSPALRSSSILFGLGFASASSNASLNRLTASFTRSRVN